MVVEFIIPGEPQGKGRPRFTKTGHTYTPDATREYEQRVKWAFRTQCRAVVFDEKTPLMLSVHAYMERPKSASRITRQLMGAGKLRPLKKPDWDNIGKIVADALNGIAYHDDAQIVDANVHKYYCADGEEPRCYVCIMEAYNVKEDEESDNS